MMNIRNIVKLSAVVVAILLGVFMYNDVYPGVNSRIKYYDNVLEDNKYTDSQLETMKEEERKEISKFLYRTYETLIADTKILGNSKGLNNAYRLENELIDEVDRVSNWIFSDILSDEIPDLGGK